MLCARYRAQHWAVAVGLLSNGVGDWAKGGGQSYSVKSDYRKFVFQQEMWDIWIWDMNSFEKPLWGKLVARNE